MRDEIWFKNLMKVRELVERQASRVSRTHLLASIDEAVRRLDELEKKVVDLESQRL